MREIAFARGASQIREPALAIQRLEGTLGDSFKDASDIMRRPWTFVQVTDANSPNCNARPWDFMLVKADRGQMNVILPDPDAPGVSGTPIGIRATGSLAHPIVARTLSGTTVDVTAGPEGSLTIWSDGVEWRVVSSHRARQIIRPFFTGYPYAPRGCWGFHLGPGVGLKDYSGASLDLSVEVGDAKYNFLVPRVGAFYFDGATRIYRSTFESALAITGDHTFIGVGAFERYPDPTAVAPLNLKSVVSHGASGESEAQNVLYSLYMGRAGGTTIDYQSWFHYDQENGAGINTTYGVNTWAALGQPVMFGYTKTSGVVQFYMNNVAFGAASSALTTPTGGTDGRFRLGGFPGFDYFQGTLMGAALIPTALTAAQWLERYNYHMGPLYGFGVL